MKYLLSYTIPIAVLASLHPSGWTSGLAVFYAFGALPLLERFLPASPMNLSPEEESRRDRATVYDVILRSMVPVQLLLLHRFLGLMSHPPGGSLEIAGWVSSMGVACGVIGINVAHELGHRRRTLDRMLARLLLSTSLYWQFFVEHNRGHHKNVSTPGDPESARLGESLYRFWIRSIRDSFLSAWRLDAREMAMGLLFQGALCAGIGHFFGASALLAFLGASLFGILLLQAVNYIEHYGLERGRTATGGYLPVEPRHSWNSDHFLSRAVLFELSRHSDHHAHAGRKYPVLRHLDPSPQLPQGYPAMILLALIPPLWFSVMNPRVALTKP
jgi:alkane 1-monooxygenase